MDKFVLKSNYKPMGDQPQAIDSLANGVLDGDKEQVLLGVTGSGKTFTILILSKRSTAPRLSLHITRHLRHSCAVSSRSFFRIMLSNIL